MALCSQSRTLQLRKRRRLEPTVCLRSSQAQEHPHDLKRKSVLELDQRQDKPGGSFFSQKETFGSQKETDYNYEEISLSSDEELADSSDENGLSSDEEIDISCEDKSVCDVDAGRFLPAEADTESVDSRTSRASSSRSTPSRRGRGFPGGLKTCWYNDLRRPHWKRQRQHMENIEHNLQLYGLDAQRNQRRWIDHTQYKMKLARILELQKEIQKTFARYYYKKRLRSLQQNQSDGPTGQE